jgi:hypothetical protein
MKLNVDKNQKGIIVGCPKCGNVFDISITKIASELGSLGGLRRKANLTQEERSSQASKASKARWLKVNKTKNE